MLATDSPILPHKINGSYTQQVKRAQHTALLCLALFAVPCIHFFLQTPSLLVIHVNPFADPPPASRPSQYPCAPRRPSKGPRNQSQSHVPGFFGPFSLFWDYDCNLCNRLDIVAENFLSDIKLRARKDNKGILPRRDRSQHTLYFLFFLPERKNHKLEIWVLLTQYIECDSFITFGFNWTNW